MVQTDLERLDHLRQKAILKEQNGIDTTGELCEMLDELMDVTLKKLSQEQLNDLFDKILNTTPFSKQYMKLHLSVLPADNRNRILVLQNNLKKLLPNLSENSIELSNIIEDMFITLGALSEEIDQITEEGFEDCELPVDMFVPKLCDSFSIKKNESRKKYYDITVKYLYCLMNILKQSMESNDLAVLQAVSIRCNLMSLQYEQIYDCCFSTK